MAKVETFHCSVVTPERAVLECEARFVAFPAHDGEMGVLPNRAPLVCKLGIGPLRVEGTDAAHVLFIDGGFAQMLDNRLSILTKQAHATTTSPTYRGLFLMERLLCRDVPAPPPGVVTELPPSSEAPTMRERLAVHLSDPYCAGCHQMPDTLGLSLENFDALGRFREEENGEPIDASGAVEGIGAFAGPEELAALLAESPEVSECLLRNLYRHASGHVEVEGTMGEAPEAIRLVQTSEEARTVEVNNPEKVAVITQTTLSVDDTRDIIEVLKGRFPNLVVPTKDDICYATQNRQNAVKAIAREAEVILIIGAKNSSNSIRLTEVAEDAGRRAHLINDAGEIDPAWFNGATCVGVTSGASAPEHLVQEVVERLKTLGATRIEEWELVKEDVSFGLPAELIHTTVR